MVSIIVCEGKTDAILISYYLRKTKNWSYTKNGPFTIDTSEHENEECNWYRSRGNYLAIWHIGGISRFQDAINTVLEINKLGNEGQFFSNVVLISDRDNDTEEDRLRELAGYFQIRGVNANLVNREWTTTQFMDEFNITRDFNIGALAIPFDRQGAMETFLLDTLSGISVENQKVVDAVIEFINSIESNYLNTPRLKLKAQFTATLSIMFPEKVFTKIDELLVSIPWEDYRQIQSGFQLLEQI